MEQFWSFFSFPLNLILAAIWIVGWWMLWRNHSDNVAVRFLLSPAATISAICLLVGSGLWIGFTGDREFTHSAFFAAVLLYVQTVVFLIILRGWKRPGGVIRWRFLLIHTGFLLALGAGFWGSPDSSELRVMLGRGETVREAYRLDGSIGILPYELMLKDFEIKFGPDGKPVHYEARVSVDDGIPVNIRVNFPYNVKFGEDIYLASVSESGCVFQIVREPWRYFAIVGILMLIAGAFMLFLKGPRR